MDVDVHSVDFAVENLLMVLVLDYLTLARAPRSWHIKEVFQLSPAISSAVGISVLLALELLIALSKSTLMNLNIRLQKEWPCLKGPVEPVSLVCLGSFLGIQSVMRSRVPLINMHGVPDPLHHPRLLPEWIKRWRSFIIVGPQVLFRSV